jgi:hypothetical protein
VRSAWKKEAPKSQKAVKDALCCWIGISLAQGRPITG